MKRWIGIGIAVVVVVALAATGATWYAHRDQGAADFQTVPVKRGDLTALIGATGTLEPEEVVDVGAQVAGQITSFGNDSGGKPVNYGSQVTQGMVLARIDDVLFKADRDSAQAALDAANANVAKAQADVGQMQAKLQQAQADWDRAKQIGQQSEALARTTYDSYRFGYQIAVTNVEVAKAELASAQAGVPQAKAALERAQRNLDYTTITSPVNGVIIDRRVNIGQTVVASLNTPSLFLIAKDLKRMQVWASVNEADIGNIRPGQNATFTVDALPNRVFKAVVDKVRLNATMTQNVVTYTVELNVDNGDRALLPYQTANVSFQVATHKNVLLVPNAALRWSPSTPEQIAPQFRDAASSGAAEGGGGRRRGGGTASTPPPAEQAGGAPTTAPASGAHHKGGGEHHRGVVWIQDGDFAKPIQVRLGLTDGTNTEINSDELKEGAAVITGEARGEAGDGDAKNPFMPNFHKKKK